MHVWLVLGWYWPAGQSVHKAATTLAYWPLAHVVQDSALYVALNFPALHATQEASLFMPARPKLANPESLYLPGTHAGVGETVGDAVG
jgi:hypothetical protein